MSNMGADLQPTLEPYKQLNADLGGKINVYKLSNKDVSLPMELNCSSTLFWQC